MKNIITKQPVFTDMLWHSTRDHTRKVTFETALFEGLAPDNGLYMPDYFPSFSQAELSALKNKPLPDIGLRILDTLLQGDIPSAHLKEICYQALSFPIPLKQVGNYQVLELFHGPTMAFKDIAAQVLARLMEHYLKAKNQKLTLLVATSGDTGGAVAQGFANRKNINVIILFPKDKISKVQEYQLTHVTDNIFPIEVNGTFDDCQAFVKKAFADKELRQLNLSTANSINIGRLLPQIIYYAWTSCQFDQQHIRFVVPSGNMGNITAGLFAKQMGFPIDHFTIACNANDPVVEYYKTGNYRSKETISTMSSAMDIGNPSNFERILYLYNNNHSMLKKDISACSVNDTETIDTIQNTYKKYLYLMDPHTAVAWKAAEKIAYTKGPTVIVSTASPSKFAEEIYQSTGIRQEKLSERFTYSQRRYHAEKTYSEIKNTILSVFPETQTI